MRTESGADHQVSESWGGHGQSVSGLDQRTRGWPSPTSLRLMDFTTTIDDHHVWSLVITWSRFSFSECLPLLLDLAIEFMLYRFHNRLNVDGHHIDLKSRFSFFDAWFLFNYNRIMDIGQPALDEHYCVCYMWNKLQFLLEVKSLNPEYK